MIEPKEVEITSGDVSRKFIISKVPAVAGREVFTQYPMSSIPKLGDYTTNEVLMLKMMTYVSGVPPAGPPVPLVNRDLVDCHVTDFEMLLKLEWAMVEHNCSFFRGGKASTFLDDILEKLPALTTSILMPLLEQLSQKDSPPSTS